MGLDPCLDNPVTYANLQLPIPQACIRLLTILPGREDDTIRCRLKVVGLSTFRKYEALSYTWGAARYEHLIEVNSRPFYITENLWRALADLRYATRPRTIWVDAICINQFDFRERIAQIREMGNIFRLAERVVIWLGPGNDASDHVFHCSMCASPETCY